MSGHGRGELRRLKDGFRGGYNGVGESPYPLLWGGHPSVQQGLRVESLQPKYQKSEKSRHDTMVNCSCEWLNTAGGDHVRGGVLPSEISPRQMGVAQRWLKMVEVRQQERDMKMRVNETQA